ncbi:MAG: metallophosphoesterase family protein [Planctomycetota bacterium]
MKRAIISDIHANLEAFESVLSDIRDQGADSIYCLGDVVGYGPDPRPCLFLAKDLDLNLMGNHEEAVLFEPIGFNPRARAAIEWTKEQINLHSAAVEENRELWNFVGSMLDRQTEDGIAYVHGSPREPTREYVFPNDVHNGEKLDEIFAALEQSVCFAGHTHTPGVFTEDHRFLAPTDIGNSFKLSDATGKIIVNVGSVGQPRDGDPRACYVIFDGESIEFRRVKYDIEKTVQRFREVPVLPEYLALRLLEGR